MKTSCLFAGFAVFACASGLHAEKAQATQILVAKCVEFAACYGGTVPWSDTLSLAQLTALGLSTDVPLIATQTSQYTIRLGSLTADFSTTTGPDSETLPDFNGNGNYADPGPYQPSTVVGTFFVPDNATGLTISGTFGNSTIGSSAGVNICLGSGPCSSTVPEASTWAMMLLGLAGLGFVGYGRSGKIRLASAA